MRDVGFDATHVYTEDHVGRGIFVCLVLGGISVIWIILGATAIEVLILVWGTLFLGLPTFGVLYVSLKLREYLRDILAALNKSA